MKSSDTQMELVRRYLGGEATLEEARRLESMLAVDAQLRRDYLAYARVEAGLSAKVRPNLVKTVPLNRWLTWRPIAAAAAAGLVIGLFSASVVFGYVSPKLTRQPLALADAAFERMDKILPTSATPRHGVWSGDGDVVAAQRGAVPVEGGRMLRFVSTHEAARGAADLRLSVAQVVDMRSRREMLREGNAVVDCSAAFNGAAESDPERTIYRIDVRAYAGHASVLQRPFPERAGQEVAHSMWRTEADFNPASWQRVSGSLILPPETDFLLIELKVFRPARGASEQTAESAHYVDDVRMSLVTTPGSKAVVLNSSKP